ncbi:hypothetical protein HYS91_03070 [Candidatus Daviesbacteria bacterium]|nr:hypothetical protein [Candidatus Daviesbacteria bacterium]
MRKIKTVSSKDQITEGLEELDVKRGIYLSGRTTDGNLESNFGLYYGSKRNKLTYLIVALIFSINLFITLPILLLDLSPFYHSSILELVANFLSIRGILGKSAFYLLLTLISFNFTPIAFYFFVRNNVLNQELPAFLATLLFILPNPLFGNHIPLIFALFSGDGAHLLAFPFILFFLMYMQQYLISGVKTYWLFTALGGAFIAIISPFAFFNFLLVYFLLGIGEGFLGGFRAKFGKVIGVLIAILSLSFFWYSPQILSQIQLLPSVRVAFSKFYSTLPFAAPVILILGILSFMFFDRREKLQPIFLGFSLFLIYDLLYIASKTLEIPGIFTPERYILELSFAAAFFFALMTSFLFQYFWKKYILSTHSKFVIVVYELLAATFAGLLLLVGYFNFIKIDYPKLYLDSLITSSIKGIGNLQRSFNFQDPATIFSISVSAITLIILLFLFFKSLHKRG